MVWQEVNANDFLDFTLSHKLKYVAEAGYINFFIPADAKYDESQIPDLTKHLDNIALAKTIGNRPPVCFIKVEPKPAA